MNEQRNRQLSAIVGTFLVLIAGGVVLLVENLLKTPLLLSQVTLLGLAGIFDIVAATDTRLTDRWAWYQWSGLGNILLGLSLPLGFVGSENSLFFVLVAAIGGLSLAAMGIDMLVYHGQYTRSERLDRNST
ncbi:hypothetical protein E2L06_18720 [Haloterrigena sp. H1]|uniref:SPW repeat-containing protein n=1 Tax=Natrinema hispanicum TaxID=392421 RepID=A0A1G6X1C9_9EURY|nr:MULTISPECIES: hypothetical protein [Natrialbaceae]TMT77995.1 hypothetical protein E2L06_20785 [Haloterrigena sp. H1]TMT80284.1 hypothetical protein E2L06_18720 [Haloterrigena sp. H1]SDD71839.1 hypothetical protein SAMN05192552_104221 [Natrinema hispanicum]SEU07275.1 hypothetical protein SAMN04488694_1379 [Natrinema hispanicum]